jgi:hypothetical protein
MFDAIHRAQSPRARKLFLRLRYVLFLVFLVVFARYTDASRLPGGFLVSLFGDNPARRSLRYEERAAHGTRPACWCVIQCTSVGSFYPGLKAVASAMSISPLPMCVIYYFYMVNRVQREERRLTEILGQPLPRLWRAREPLASPAFGRLTDPAVRFQLQVLFRNNGHWNLLGHAVLRSAVQLRRYFR